MQSGAATVKEYLASLPDERRKTLGTLRALIRKNLPKGYREVMDGMVGYVVPLETYPDTYNGQPLAIAGFASQKNYISLYLMGVYGNADIESWFKAEFAKSGKKLNMGKCCLRFKTLDDIPLGLIGRTIARVPMEDFIGWYEAVKGKSARAARQKPGARRRRG